MQTPRRKTSGACRLFFASALVTAVVSFPGTVTAQSPGANLAWAATPSASYTSGDTATSALNDGFAPRNSADNRHGSYGNWNRSGTQWVQYNWSQPISTGRVEVYWWADGQGVHLPVASRLSYWDGSKFVPLTNASGLGVAGNQYNATTFDPVTTTRLRLDMDGEGRNSTGILQWKVIDSGASPKFPPVVLAGVDRDVVLGGKTYLTGTLKGPDGAATWSKAAGPGGVTFENANALATTAEFSTPGDYVLKLTAKAGDATSDGTLKVKVTEPPPSDRLDVVYTKTFKVNNPLWSDRVKSLIVGWIPHCIDEINSTNIPRDQGDGGIDNFVESAKALAGEPHANHKGYVFANAWVHQTVEAMCIALQVDPQGDADIIKAQNKMKATLDDWIPKILAAQEPDGYLQTAYTLRSRTGGPWRPNVDRWTPASRGNHEGYTAGYFIESAINHYTMTQGKDKRLYDAAKKLADCWCDNIGPAPKKAWYDGHEEMEQALVRFGRFVNDMEGAGHGDRYIALSKFLLDCRSTAAAASERKQDYDQTQAPVTQQYEAVGHAVRAVYLYSGMADVAAETHNTDYQSAVLSLWDNLMNKKYYVTGGIGSGETSEGFGPDYSLRNNAYCESCSSCGEIFFQYKMNLAYHDAKYADAYEETMYNALLGSTDLKGQTFFYDNPLAGGRRTLWNACPCCVGNIPRTLLMLPTWMYVKGQDSLYVNLFIGSTITVENIAGTDVQIEQVTDYPWSGKVALTVNPKTTKTFTVNVRVPNHKTSELYAATPKVGGLTSLSVNGQPITPVMDKGYAVITRTWQAGDKIEVEFPMQVQTVRAVDQIAADRGRVALRYGPLMYSIESVDQANKRVDQALDSSKPLHASWNADLLDGVEEIQGTFVDGTPLTAIPYYARLNRLSPNVSSQVWLRDAPAAK